MQYSKRCTVAVLLLPLFQGSIAGCTPSSTSDAAATRGEQDRYALERGRMVRNQLRARGLRDGAVIAAMAKVPRHRFVPTALQPHA